MAKNRYDRLCCAALALLLTLSCARAETDEASTAAPTEVPVQITAEAPPQSPAEIPAQASGAADGTDAAPAPTAETDAASTAGATTAPDVPATSDPSQSPDVPATSDPSQSPGVTATPDPSQSPGVPVTPDPSQSPDVPATSDPSQSPGVPATPDLSQSPDVPTTPDPSQSPDPSASPDVDPSATPMPETALNLSASGAAQTSEGIWQIALEAPNAEISFTWSSCADAAAYLCEILDEQGNSVYSNRQAECGLTLPGQGYASGTFLFRVRALDAEENPLAEDSLRFQCTQSAPGGPGFPGGGRPSGGGGRGPGGAAEMDAAEQGFRVTPGEAFASGHASGTKDMQLYGTVDLTPPEGAVTRLTLGGTDLAVSLDDEGCAFTVASDGDALVLTPEGSGEAWTINAQALKVLERSGVARLILLLDGTSIELSTGLELQGAVYAALRAQGFVSKDFELRVSAADVAVSAGGQTYILNESGELCPL